MVQSWLETFSNMLDPESLGASTLYTPFLQNTHFNEENPSWEDRISGGAESSYLYLHTYPLKISSFISV